MTKATITTSSIRTKERKERRCLCQYAKKKSRYPLRTVTYIINILYCIDDDLLFENNASNRIYFSYENGDNVMKWVCAINYLISR